MSDFEGSFKPHESKISVATWVKKERDRERERERKREREIERERERKREMLTGRKRIFLGKKAKRGREKVKRQRCGKR
jgi:hypothetical protein